MEQAPGLPLITTSEQRMEIGVLSTFLFLTLAVVNADEIHTCKLVYESNISSKEDDPSKLNGKAEASTEDFTIIFAETKSGGTIKGKGKSSLKRVSSKSFIETTTLGDNVIFWTLVPKKDGTPAYLVKNSALDLFGFATWTAVFKCE